MSEKKGGWASLFGGSTGCCCNKTDGCGSGKAPEKPKKGGCCDMKIVEASEDTSTQK